MTNQNILHNLIEIQAFYNSGGTKEYSFRLNKLKNLHASIKAYESELIAALKLDLNKPVLEAYASEISIIYDEINHARKNLKRWMKRKMVASPLSLFYSQSYIYKVPLGIVLIISPWNYPVQLALLPLIGAVAAGNCVVLKLSEFTLHVNQVLQTIIAETFSKDYIIQLDGDGALIIPELINSGFLNHVFFTGSTSVGRIIAAECAKHLIPYTLELGGKSPTIVDETASLDIVAKRIVWAKFYNAGQTCVAPDYILVHQSIKTPLIENLKKYIDKFYTGNFNDYAKIITQKRFDTLCGYIDIDSILYGGRSDRNNLQIEPTLINEPDL